MNIVIHLNKNAQSLRFFIHWIEMKHFPEKQLHTISLRLISWFSKGYQVQ